MNGFLEFAGKTTAPPDPRNLSFGHVPGEAWAIT
jgi:hypothetical protein